MSQYDHDLEVEEEYIQDNGYPQNYQDQDDLNQKPYNQPTQSQDESDHANYHAQTTNHNQKQPQNQKPFQNQKQSHNKNTSHNQKQSRNPNHNNNDGDSDNEQEENTSQNRSQRSSAQSQELQLTDEQKLQNQIISIAIDQEESTPYQNELTMELLQKLKDFEHLAKSKTGQDYITVRIQQLVINKVLVLTYNKSQLRLILSHYHLGQAYLQNQCIQQAIQHISIALHKIQKVFDSIPQTRLLQTYMQNQLAKAFIVKQNFQDAIELLTSSINEENRIKQLKKLQRDEKQDKNTKTLVLLCQCYSKINEYEHAVKVIDQVISITKRKKMAKQEYAFALVQKAKILAFQKNFNAAVTHQEEAIDILMEQNYSKPEQVAQLYTVLSSYHQELNNVENSLTCIQKVKTLYQELYSAQDKRVIKARRKIATYLLKSQRFKQAVNELLQVVELQQKIFGENSLQTARTLKLLGAVYISMEIADARAYLKRAMNIFQSHGNKKQVQQIRDKLKLLYHDGQTDPKDIRATGSQHEI